MGWYEEEMKRQAEALAKQQAEEQAKPGPREGRTPPTPIEQQRLGPRIKPPVDSWYAQEMQRQREAIRGETPGGDVEGDVIKTPPSRVTEMTGYAMAGPDISAADRKLKPTWADKADAWLAKQAKNVTDVVSGGDAALYQPRHIEWQPGTKEFPYPRAKLVDTLPELGTSGDTANPFQSERDDKGRTQVAPFSGTGMKSLGIALVSQTPKIRAEAMQATLPGSKILYLEGDLKKENPIIEWEGKRYQVNEPGMSGADVMKFAGDVIVNGILSRAGIALRVPGLAPGAGRLKSGAGQAGLGGVSSLVQDFAAGALGSDSATNRDEMLERAGLSAAFSGILGTLFGKSAGTKAAKDLPAPGTERPEITNTRARAALGLDPIKTVGEAMEAMPSQSLLAAGRKRIRDAGRDPNAFKPTQIAYIGNLGDDVDRAGVNAVLSKMSDRPDIPLTRGQTTMDAPTIALEQRLEKATSGPASDIMSSFRNTQDAAIRNVRDRMVVNPLVNEEQFGRDVLESIRAAEKTADEKVGEAYRRVGPTPEAAADLQAGRTAAGKDLLSPEELRGRQLLFKPGASVELPDAVSAYLRANDAVINDNTPAAGAMLDIIHKATRSDKIAGTDRFIPKVFNVEDMEQTRRLINAQIKGAANDTDFRAAQLTKQAYDKWVDDAIERGLYMGDAEVVGKLKAARELRTEYGKKFEPQNIDETVGNFIQRAIHKDLNGKQVADYILGASQITGGRNTRQLIDRFTKIGGGDDSPLMESVRDATRRRILFGADTEAKSPSTLDPGRMARDIRSAFSGKGDAVTTRLLPGEKQEWLALADRLDQVAKREPGSVKTTTPSGGDVANLADNFLVKMITVPIKGLVSGATNISLVREFGEGVGKSYRKSQANAATSSTPLRKLVPGLDDTPRFQGMGKAGLQGATPGIVAGRETADRVDLPSAYDLLFGESAGKQMGKGGDTLRDIIR